MNHELFGTFKYENGYWLGEVTLPAFAAVSQLPPEPDWRSDPETKKMFADFENRMRAMLGNDEYARRLEAARALAAEQPVAMNVPDAKAEARERERAEQSRQQAARVERGGFLVHIRDPQHKGPTARQEAAFRHFMARADAVLQAVIGQVLESYRDAYSQAHWRRTLRLKKARSSADLAGQYAIERVEIYQAHHKGSSYLVFPLAVNWQDERDHLVVYHPDRPVAWTLDEGLDELIRSDEPVDDE